MPAPTTSTRFGWALTGCSPECTTASSASARVETIRVPPRRIGAGVRYGAPPLNVSLGRAGSRACAAGIQVADGLRLLCSAAPCGPKRPSQEYSTASCADACGESAGQGHSAVVKTASGPPTAPSLQQGLTLS